MTMKHNWEYKRLGDLCNFIGGGTPSKSNEDYFNGNIPWATVRDMLSFQLSDTELHITSDAVNNSATNILPKGMIIISTHVGLGKICELMQETAINQDLKGISFFDNSVDKYFFVYWYRSIANYIISKGRGATVKGVTLDFMRSLQIPVPTMEVQKQIVEELDKINEIIEDCRELLRNLDVLAQSLFYDLFGDPVINSKGWQTQALSEIAPQHPYKGNFSVDDNIWLLNLDMIEKNTGRIINRHKIKYEDIGNSVYKIGPNQVLYSKLRPNLNKVVISDDFGYCTSELLPLNPQKGFLNCQYLAYLLRTKECVTLFSGKVAGAKMPRTDLKAFRTFQIPIPPFELQEKFSARIEQIEAQKKTVEETIANLQVLLDSRMDYWFN